MCSTSLPLRFLFYFFPLSSEWSRANSGAIQYLYVSFCLLSTAKGGGLSCVRFATAAIRLQLLKRWTRPSVWVGRFIKWQTGSLYLANVSCGRWRWRACVGVCVSPRGTHSWRERDEKGCKFRSANTAPYQRENDVTDVLSLLKGFCFIFNDNWARGPFRSHLIPQNTDYRHSSLNNPSYLFNGTFQNSELSRLPIY